MAERGTELTGGPNSIFDSTGLAVALGFPRIALAGAR